MEKIGLKELKEIQIAILVYVADFCKKNDINYWLDAGTLLGAIRHNGYIPWDDDIDIGMLRPDYEKFMKLFNLNNTSNYKARCYENDKNWYYPYGKVIDESTVLYEPDEKSGIKSSVFIDVFVYDNAPQSKKELEIMYRKRDRYAKLNSIQVSKHFTLESRQKYNFLRFPFWLIFQLLPKRIFVKKSIENSKKYVNNDTGYVGNFTSVTKIFCPKSIFDSFIEVDFEGKKFFAPIGYDEWLKAFYGNYMELPPKEKRVSHHKFVAYKK